MVRLDEPESEPRDDKGEKSQKKPKDAEVQTRNVGAAGVNLGLIPMPKNCSRVIPVPGDGFNYVLLEHVVEMAAARVFSMYSVADSNIMCITRNADIDTIEAVDAVEDVDYREFMKSILKKRSRLTPVRLEVQKPIQSKTIEQLLLKHLSLTKEQVFVTTVPLRMDYAQSLTAMLPDKLSTKLTCTPFTPQWPSELDPAKPIMPQIRTKDVLLSYPYESMDPFVALLREAANDPNVVSIKITLYRLASQSHLAEALIAAAENGKEVVALFELRARFDESNNIMWSQRFEAAGCKVLYGFRDLKVHSKVCCITRRTADGVEYITQLGTGNYNEKTSKLYTDFSYITSDEGFGRDATKFFLNMSLENVSDDYHVFCVAPLQIKPLILKEIDCEIERKRAGKPCGVLMKTNSVTDVEIIEKVVEASQAGVPVTLFVRGICCLVPKVKGFTENVTVVSIVGRLLEHSRIYAFGPRDDMRVFLSSADLMTRNMDKRIEVAWPVVDDVCRRKIVDYLDICLSDNVKLRKLKSSGRYTGLNRAKRKGEPPVEAQEILICQARERRTQATAQATLARAAERRNEPAAGGGDLVAARNADHAAVRDTADTAATSTEPPTAQSPKSQTAQSTKSQAAQSTEEPSGRSTRIFSKKRGSKPTGKSAESKLPQEKRSLFAPRSGGLAKNVAKNAAIAALGAGIGAAAYALISRKIREHFGKAK